MVRLPLVGLLLLLIALGGPPPPAAADEGEAVSERARKQAIKALRKDLRKEVRRKRPLDEVRQARMLEMLEALEALGGPEAAEAGLVAAAVPDEAVRDAVFDLVDREHGPELVGPLGDLLEDKEHRRDADLRQRVARSLSVAADPAAMVPLASLMRTDEDPDVVAAAADALATYASARIELRKPAVRELVDVYTTTYNLMLSMKPEQRVIASEMKKRWKVYGGAVRSALQALTGQSLTRPQDWRTWWNKNKKKKRW